MCYHAPNSKGAINLKFMVMQREHFFRALGVLHHPQLTISEAGSLWITLWLSEPQIVALAGAGIHCGPVSSAFAA